MTTLDRVPAPGVGGANGHVDNPRTAVRRARTRKKLLDAARVVFERDGFHDARLADIVREAGVATGTFYNYYRSKEEIFRDLVTLVIADLVQRPEHEQPRDDPIASIYEANRAYVAGYRRNARMMTILLQIGRRAEVRDLGIGVHNTFEDRIARAIERWQRDGLVYPDLDPVYTANALSYMVDRFLYEWTVLDLDYDQDKVVETLSRLWVRSLGLEQPALKRPRGAAARPGRSLNVRPPVARGRSGVHRDGVQLESWVGCGRGDGSGPSDERCARSTPSWSSCCRRPARSPSPARGCGWRRCRSDRWRCPIPNGVRGRPSGSSPGTDVGSAAPFVPATRRPSDRRRRRRRRVGSVTGQGRVAALVATLGA